MIEKDNLDSLDYFVPKPWGREYLCWRSKSCAIWLLELNNSASTSFHCHTKKNTGLIVLDGKIQLSLINSEYVLNPLEKINIFRGRFHSSKCISENGAIMLEVEAPVDKRDLIRWEDNYGRENLSYEKKILKFKTSDSRLMLDIDESESSFKTSYRDKKFEVLRGDLINENIIDSGLFICLEGGLGVLDPQQLVVVPGDVCSSLIMKKLYSKFKVTEDSIFLRILEV